MKTRSSAQIRSHAQKYLIKLSKKFDIQDTKQLKNFKNIKCIKRGNFCRSLKADQGIDCLNN